MADDSTVQIKVVTTSDGKGVEQAEQGLAKLGATATNSAGSLSSMAAAFGIGQIAANAFNKVVSAGVNLIKDSYNAYSQQDLALTRLQTGINNVKSATDKHIGALVEQAQALQKTTRFSDDQYESAQGILATFQLNQRAISALTPRLGDMAEGLARVTGEMPDLEGNAMLVAKAIGGEDTAGLANTLRRAGVQMTEFQQQTLKTGNMQQRMAIITQVLDMNFRGMAQSAGDSAAGGVAKLGNVVNDAQEQFGMIEHAIGDGFLGALTQLVGGNTQAIASLGAATVAVVVLGGAILGIGAIIKAVSFESLIAVALNPLTWAFLALAAVIGVVVYKAMGNFQKQVTDAQKSAQGFGGSLGSDIPAGASKASGAMSDLADKLKDIDDQINRANRDFREQMATMIQSHEDKVTTFKGQLAEENTDFDNTQKSKEDDFKDSQQNILDEHNKTIGDLNQQYQDELLNGRRANQKKLKDIQTAIADENAKYDKQVADKQEQYTKDVTEAQKSHDKKTTALQQQLDAENALLTKHASDVAGIRQGDFIDEIDKLKRSHTEQLAAFDKQKKDIIKNANETASGIGGAFSDASAPGGSLDLAGKAMGDAMGRGLKTAFEGALKDVGKGAVNYLTRIGSFISTKGLYLNDPKNKNKSVSEIWNATGMNESIFNDGTQAGKKAAGGPVSAGEPYWVGDNPDGSLNSTSELFVPSQSGTIVPANKTRGMLGGKSVTFNQTNHIYNSVDLEAANKEMGWRLANA